MSVIVKDNFGKHYYFVKGILKYLNKLKVHPN
jgi:hypothetical protein